MADEMGLGKTLQMIALVKSLRDSGQLGICARGLPRLARVQLGRRVRPVRARRAGCALRAPERTARCYYSVRRRG
ncbi:MAG: SNF2-related protein [Coriobacteriaceae bacterium]